MDQVVWCGYQFFVIEVVDVDEGFVVVGDDVFEIGGGDQVLFCWIDVFVLGDGLIVVYGFFKISEVFIFVLVKMFFI